MHCLKKMCETEKITKETAEDIENKLGFGLDIETATINKKLGKRKKIHETDRDIFMDMKIKNKNDFELKCAKTNQSIRGLLPKKFDHDRLGIMHQGIYYTEEHGETTEEPKGYHIMELNGLFTDSLKEELATRKKDLSEVCDMFNINPKPYMYNEKTLTRAILYENVKYLQGCEHVTLEENKYLDGAFVGALNYAQYDKAFVDGFGYDINSFYPYVMSKTDFKFPLSTGIIKTTSKKYPLEIKKLKINGTHKYWRNSPDNYYDSYQVQLLELLKIPYEEVKAPKLCYEEPVQSSALFSYFDDIYELKKKGNKHAKLILNSCWGQLSRKKEYEIDGNSLRDEDIEKVIDYIESRNVFILREEKPFKFVFGRIKTFLHSYVRLSLIRDYVLPVEKQGFEIYQIKTDAFVTNAKPEDITLGKEMGDLKLEKEYKGFWRVENKKRIIDENYI